MQTFLPYPDLERSAFSLDRMRLGKQRVETLQIMQVLLGVRFDKETGEIVTFEPRGWVNHPAVKMWRGYEVGLLRYQKAVCDEWVGRGHADTCLDKTTRLVEYVMGPVDLESAEMPPWYGDPELHLSHRSNLVRKAEEFYLKEFGPTPGDLEYVWPV